MRVSIVWRCRGKEGTTYNVEGHALDVSDFQCEVHFSEKRQFAGAQASRVLDRRVVVWGFDTLSFETHLRHK